MGELHLQNTKNQQTSFSKLYPTVVAEDDQTLFLLRIALKLSTIVFNRLKAKPDL